MGLAESKNAGSDDQPADAHGMPPPIPFLNYLERKASSMPSAVRATTPPPAPHGPIVDQAREAVRRALDLDEAGSLAEAFSSYDEAVQLLICAVRKDPGVKDELGKIAQQCLTRAEELKPQLSGKPGSERRPPRAGKTSEIRASLSPSKSAPALAGRRASRDAKQKAADASRRLQSASSSGARADRFANKKAEGGGAARTSTASPANEYEATVLQEMLNRSPGTSWDQIAGLHEAKQTLQESVILPNIRPDLFHGLRAPPKGVLLFGPPGTGKTLLARAVASESGFAFFSISASSLVSKYLGDGEKMVRALFNVARKKQPAVIYIDEIDSIMSARHDGEHEASRRLKTEVLVQLDGAATDSEDRVLMLASTNLPWALDDALMRRLAKRVYISLPDQEARAALISTLLNSQRHDLKEKDFRQLWLETDGYSCSDLTAVCKDAALEPIRECGSSIKSIRAEQLRPLKLNDFVKAMQRVRPSVSPVTLRQFDEWLKQNGY